MSFLNTQLRAQRNAIPCFSSEQAEEASVKGTEYNHLHLPASPRGAGVRGQTVQALVVEGVSCDQHYQLKGHSLPGKSCEQPVFEALWVLWDHTPCRACLPWMRTGRP